MGGGEKGEVIMHRDLYKAIGTGIAICTTAWLLSGCVTDWSTRDKWLLVGSTVAMGLDVHSTDRAIDRGYHEAGPAKYVIGEKPDTGELIMFGVGSQALTVWAADYWEDLRPWILGTTGGVHAGCAVYNYTELRMSIENID